MDVVKQDLETLELKLKKAFNKTDWRQRIHETDAVMSIAPAIGEYKMI